MREIFVPRYSVEVVDAGDSAYGIIRPYRRLRYLSATFLTVCVLLRQPYSSSIAVTF